MKLKIFLAFIFLIVIVISTLLYGIRIGLYYDYSTLNNEFVHTSYPNKGGTIYALETRFKNFKESKPEYEDLILYRRFRIEPWKFWLWAEYLGTLDWWWGYSYLKPEPEVEKKPSPLSQPE